MQANEVKTDIASLTSAFHNFSDIIERFENTFANLQEKIDILTEQVEIKTNFLNNILENTYDGVVVIDTFGKITNFNRAAETITGFTKDEILGKPYKIFFDENTSDYLSALYTLSTNKELYRMQKTILTKDKAQKEVEFSSTLLKDNEKKILGVIETFNDISEIKLLRERMTHIETLAALGEMSASVAHEIRNPLAGITGFAGLLDRNIDEDDSRKSLVKSILAGTTRLNDIISNLLKLTRPQSLTLTKINLNDFLTELTGIFKSEIGNSTAETISVLVEIEDTKTNIFCDVQLMQQVLINILRNAYDAYMDLQNDINKINIIVKTYDFDDEIRKNFSYVEITISDYATGMSNEVIQKIFNPFFTTKHDGNGLGLAICKKIIQLHKGDISVNSKLGKGTNFVINLPLYKM